MQVEACFTCAQAKRISQSSILCKRKLGKSLERVTEVLSDMLNSIQNFYFPPRLHKLVYLHGLNFQAL